MKKFLSALMILSLFAAACSSTYDNDTDTNTGSGSVTDDDSEGREIDTDLFTLEIEGDDVNFSKTSSSVKIQNYESSSTTYELKDDDYNMEILLTGSLDDETFMEEYPDAEETTVSGMEALYATEEDVEDSHAYYLIELESGEYVQINIMADSQDGIDEAKSVVEGIEWKDQEESGSSTLQRIRTDEESEDKEDIYDDKMGY